MITVGSYQSPSSVSLCRLEAPRRRGSRARSTNPSTRLRWSGWITGEMVVVGVSAVAENVGVGVGVEAIQNSSRHRLLDQEPVPARQTWPLSSNCPAGLPGGCVDVADRRKRGTGPYRPAPR